MLVGNLLDNAVRYTPSQGQVDVALEVAGAVATLTVTDTGPGIPDADLGRLFDRFSRFGTADTEGSGLGLAIVKAIAIRHAADVAVANRGDRAGLKAAVVFQLA
jgi:two-component system OmpR family sensor kinase